VDKGQLYDLVNREGQKVDKVSVKYHNTKHVRHGMTRKRFAFIMESTRGPKVLDVGCGVGLFCTLALERDDIEEIHGVDLQEAAIEEARENVKSPKVTLHHGFAEELIYRDDYFDTVVVTETLEHVTSVDKVLSEIHRVLKPGGRIVLTVPYKGSISELHIRLFTEDSARDYIEKYFTIEDMGIFDGKDFTKNRAPKIYCVGRKT